MAAGLITPAEYHEQLKAASAGDGGSGGGAAVASAPAPRVRRQAPPTVRECTLDMGGGQHVTVMTNMGPPDPGNGQNGRFGHARPSGAVLARIA